MSQADKSRYYKALKDAGVQFTKHYREYTTDELASAYHELQNRLQASAPPPVEEAHVDPPPVQEQPIDPAAAAYFGFEEPEPPPAPVAPVAPVQERDPNEMAGQRLNTLAPDEPIRTDEHGRIWYQEEVLKPAFPKPRGRRVLQYTDTGTERQTVKQGEFTETFEVAGNQTRVAEVKITLPSYQVGIYKDPRFPFKIHTYNGATGFDLFEVQNYYGGSELVPPNVKRIYVSNTLCYDIRTTIRDIETQYRQLQLAGRI